MRLKKHHFDEVKLLYLLAGLVFLVGLVLLGWFGYGYLFKLKKLILTDAEIIQEIAEEQIVCNYKRILDGVCVKTEKEVNPAIVAVMIDNHPDGRPQAGLAEASIVYEAPVEANYTRLLAIYPADADLEKVGPVRSSRPYYLDWVEEYGNAMFMHVGGSDEALAKAKQDKVFDLNEFYRGWYYWRDFQRLPPHQIYTSSELWNKALNDYSDNYADDEFEEWSFVTTTETEKLGNKEIGEIKVSFLPPVYEAVWKYNSSTEQYERFQTDGPHTDENGKQIAADTLIVQRVRASVIDEIGRQKIATIGSGEAIVFYDGKMIKGEWRKEILSGRTDFYDENENLILLKPGKIWVEVASQSVAVSYNL